MSQQKTQYIYKLGKGAPPADKAVDLSKSWLLQFMKQ